MKPFQTLLGYLLPFLPDILLCASARSSNRTIDDQFGDNVTGILPIFAPERGWVQGSSCQGCKATLNTSKVFDRTWHDTTQHPENATFTMTASFTGTAVYVYNVLANHIPYSDTLTSLTFTLDGALVGHFAHQPTNQSVYEYNVLVYANKSLGNTNHTLLMKAAKVSKPVLILFDYIVYTVFEDDEPLPLPPPEKSTGHTHSSIPSHTTQPRTQTPQSAPSATDMMYTKVSPRRGAIIGGIVGGILFLSVVAAAALVMCVRKRSWQRPHSTSSKGTRSKCWPVLVGEGSVRDGDVIVTRNAHVEDERLGPLEGSYAAIDPPPSYPGDVNLSASTPHASQEGARTSPDFKTPSAGWSACGSGYLYDEYGVPRSVIPLEMQVAALRKELEELRSRKERWWQGRLRAIPEEALA